MSDREEIRELIDAHLVDVLETRHSRRLENEQRERAERDTVEPDATDRIEYALLLIAGALVAPVDGPIDGPIDIAEARERGIATDVTWPMVEQVARTIIGGALTDSTREIIARFSTLFTDGKTWRPPG